MQVLVRVNSTSVNPVDTAVRSGALPPKTFPKVLGGDVAGVVEAADPSSRFKAGDHVAALTPGFWCDSSDGSYCQYAVVDESWLAKVPDGVDLGIAGGLPLVGLTAWQVAYSCCVAAHHLGSFLQGLTVGVVSAAVSCEQATSSSIGVGHGAACCCTASAAAQHQVVAAIVSSISPLHLDSTRTP